MAPLQQRLPRERIWRVMLGGLIISAVLLMAACAGNDGGAPPGQHPAPQQARVEGLVVLHQKAPTSRGEALRAVPAPWTEMTTAADMTTFDRALAHANWQVRGSQTQHGTTGADGRFTIEQLSPGTHTLKLTKTLNGNLLAVPLRFTVGNNGGAQVVVQLSWGESRTVSTYTQQAERVQEIRGPGGKRLVTRNGRLGELSDGQRLLVDANGDGSFERCAPIEPATDCVPSDITALTVQGESPVVLGQPAWVVALAQLADGSEMEVTHLVTWQSSEPAVAQVNSWGEVTTLAPGTTRLTATLGTLSSDAWTLQVVPRPPLTRIYLENTGCFSILPLPVTEAVTSSIPVVRPAVLADKRLLWPPTCSQVVEVGGTLQFTAVGVFGDSTSDPGEYYEDITSEVTWTLVPAEVGEVVAGLFTGRRVGTAQLSAALEAVRSDPTTVRVVAEPSVVEISIYPAYPGAGTPGVVFPAGPGVVRLTNIAPCDDCGEYVMPVLRGDTLQFFATAYYDTGKWQDVTTAVQWRSSNPSVAPIDAKGVMTAQAAGEAELDATLGTVTSNPFAVRVVNEATLESLWIYQEGDERVVSKGGQVFFHAQGYYDIGLDRDLTTQAVWHSSDNTIGGFDTPGVFTGRAAGTVEVWAEVDGVASDRLSIEVFATSELPYCDPEHINRGVWSDEFNRVVLESDCATYEQSDTVALRYTVTELQPRFGIFDPCLDLYVYQGDTRVRTIREEGCGEPFLPATAAEFAAEQLKYQLLAFWDLKDDEDAPVPPGTYTVYGRFYLYYDPVVQLDLTVR
jgi:hypothetical protein